MRGGGDDSSALTCLKVDQAAFAVPITADNNLTALRPHSEYWYDSTFVMNISRTANFAPKFQNVPFS